MLQLAGRLQDATTVFEHVLDHHPDLFAPNLFAGLDNLKFDRPLHARLFLERAVKEEPDKVEARIGLANANLQLGNYGEALTHFTRAAVLNDKSAEAWTGLGATYLSLEKDLESNLRSQPSPYRTVLLAESYLEQGNTGKAVDSLSAAAAQKPKVPCVHSILGFAYLAESKLSDAAREFSLDWSGASGECLLARLGIVALDARQGGDEDALHELEAVNAIDPAVAQANMDMYWSSLTGERIEDRARAILRSETQKETQPARTQTPSELLREGHYSACGAALVDRPRLTPDELRMSAFCSYYTGNDEQVLTASENLLRENPGDPEALYWQIQSVERLGLEAITKARTISPDSASLHVLTGDLLQEKGDLGEAAAEYRKAVAAEPGFLAARIGLARVLNSDRKTEEAEQQIQLVLKESPDDPEANYLMGEVLVNQSKLDDALPYLLKAEKAAPAELPYVHADLSKVYEGRNQIPEAIAELKLAAPVDVDGSYHYRLGRLYMRAGNREAADAALQTAEELRHQTDAKSLYQK